MTVVRALALRLWAKIRHEPVGVWGIVLAAILASLPHFGVPASTVTLIGAAGALLGIPVVRGLVTPLQALQAFLAGLNPTPGAAALIHDPAVHLTGKGPVRHDRRTLRLADYLSPLPTAPASTSRAKKIRTWGMLGNDKLGDCTCAAAGHMIKLWTSLAGHMARVVLAAIVQAYSAVGGYIPGQPSTDQGAVELDVLNYWRRHGIAGHKIGAYAKIAPRDHALVQSACWLFDGLYIGLALPISAQRQTVWDLTTGPDAAPGSWGGHAVNVVDYNPTGPVVVTWGATKQLTWAFWDAYCDEAYALLSPDALAGGKTVEGFDLTTLKQDLAQL